MKRLSFLLAIFLAISFSVQNAQGGTIELGTSTIKVEKGASVVTQVDRVARDIAWENSRFDIHSNPQRKLLHAEDLVPYMEGFLAGELMRHANAKVSVVPLCEAERRGDNFFAKDGRGAYCFLIDPSKTTYASAKITGDYGWFVDTHGFNMIAGGITERLKSGKAVDIAIACMDLKPKADAALYLANQGVNCYGPCDRFASTLIGYKKTNPGAATIIGTAPIRKTLLGTTYIGGQSVIIDTDEPIMVQTTSDQTYPNQYSDTPSRYFQILQERYTLRLPVTYVQANAGEAEKVVHEARNRGARVIAVRVWNKEDAEPVRKWLRESVRNRAILFHSAIYEHGYTLFSEFPKQTSFGDLNPIVKK